jgi:hypothetical protein
MFLRLVLMASADAIWSLRMIAKLAHENEVYRYPTGTEKPDFRAICNFKKGPKGLIEAAFKGTVTIAKTLGIPNLGDVSTNGTKMKANASNRYTLSKEFICGTASIYHKRSNLKPPCFFYELFAYPFPCGHHLQNQNIFGGSLCFQSARNCI